LNEWLAVGSVAFAVLVVGVSYGALATAAGFPPWLVVALSATVLAASSELLFVGVILSGAAPWIAAMGALLVNLRNGVYGIAAGTFLGHGWRRLAAAHLVNDETVAYAAPRSGAGAQRRAFWTLGMAILLAWPSGATIGVVVGHSLADPSMLGLDAVFPAILIAMLTGSLPDRLALVTITFGAVIAVATTPSVPAGLAPITALAALILPLMLDRRRG
jgi:predicted branched-subunit amino acid permease